jgi:hypothetical protein
VNHTEISIRGIIREVPCVDADGRTIIATGRWLKVAEIKDEDFQDTEDVPDPSSMVNKIRQLGADLFTFSQNLTDTVPRFPFTHIWDSVAAIRITSYQDWWNNRVSTDLRCDVRKAAKRGLVVRQATFTDDFVRAIVDIYDETPIRHGRRFWHYKKGFAAVRRENATYLERSEFLGAYAGDELVGFLKMVYVGNVARMMQIIAKDAHRDKRPMNALIAKAVEICAARGCSHLTYGKFRYSREADSLTAFKKRNGFEEILVPKYYIPLTIKGRLALQFRLERGVKALVPHTVVLKLKRFRTTIYQAGVMRGRA